MDDRLDLVGEVLVLGSGTGKDIRSDSSSDERLIDPVDGAGW